MNVEISPTYWVRIFIGGDYAIAKQVCREYCADVGLCVTVQRTDYIYTYGDEQGVVIGLINYPRFPDTEIGIAGKAEKLGHLLLKRLCQKSFSLMTPQRTTWYSLDVLR